HVVCQVERPGDDAGRAGTEGGHRPDARAGAKHRVSGTVAKASDQERSPASQLARGARRGLLLVLSSPSGAGKTTLGRRLLAADPSLGMSRSVTTRAPRPGEVDGRDYHFIDAAEFSRLQAAGELLEWAEVHGNLYATPKAAVLDALKAGADVLFDIDWQGARQI